jgi:thioredoxin-related protein
MLKIIAKAFFLISLLHTFATAREINLDEFAKTALKMNKHLFVFLHKTDCGYCESMIEFTLDDDRVKSLLEKKFIFVHMNIREKDHITYKKFEGNARAFAKEVGYDFYPTSIFFDDKNEIVYAAPGYQDEERFYAILNYVDTESYKRIGFKTFKKTWRQVQKIEK